MCTSFDSSRREACVDTTGVERKTLPGDHMLFGQRQGEYSIANSATVLNVWSMFQNLTYRLQVSLLCRYLNISH